MAINISENEKTMEACPVKTCNGLATMTLDEAIEHAEAKSDVTPCGLEHAALAAWLRELRHYRNSNAAKLRDTHGVTGDGWYGFDLDGTLARYDGWKGIDHIGEPIPAMVALIKRLHAEGKIVKVMTARVAPRNDTVNGHDARYYVCEWCAKHLGFTPDVVFQKDAHMIQLYDDRVKQVVPNTGILVENLAGCGNMAKMREVLTQIRTYSQSKGRQMMNATWLFKACDAAISSPPRNCDVGTLEEQQGRFGAYCTEIKMCERCRDCIDGHGDAHERCVMEWEQAPYEAPAASGSK